MPPRRKPKRPGPKPLPPGAKRSERLQLSFTPEQLGELAAAAARAQRSLSAWCAEVLVASARVTA